MNTSELVERVAGETGMGKEGVRKVLDSVIGAITGAAQAGEPVALVGLGQFKVKDAPARQGRNPATGETMEIAASRKLSFAPAKAVKDALNGARA